DYAEKENTIAKALEDLKANFYCELCDKQYYKHQEFDNHINSYDHAHKQRLKELKQREFARNVASKSRKDERKQEKALQRLHQLAELRKETVCAPGSGPMFKSTTVTVRENLNEISRKVVDSVNGQEEFKYTLIQSEVNSNNVTAVAADSESSNNYTAKNNQLGDQALGIHRHKIGFSFAFPKKASVKLESSAAAFSEYNDDASVGKGFSRKSRFVPGACHLQLSSSTDVLLSSEEKANTIHPPEGMCSDKEETLQTQEMKEVSSKKDTLLVPPFCQLQCLLSSDSDSCQNSVPRADQIPLEDVITNEDTALNGNSSEMLGNKSTLPDMPNDCLSLQATTEENVKNNDASTTEDESKNHAPEILAPSNTEEKNINLHKKTDSFKRQCEPFVPVLNKHGSTVLQWPSEMLIYTTTEPSISYSCNPLCFDFKSTKLSNNLYKNKLSLNDLYSQQKEEDICKGPASESKDASVTGLTDYEIVGSRREYTQVTPLLADETVSKSYDSGKNGDIGLRFKNISCRIRNTGKCNSTKKQIKQDTLHEKYNKIRLKDTHEHWFHKSRRKKRKRNLCQHHHGEKTKELESHFKMEMENNYTDKTRTDLLETISEKQHLTAESLSESHHLTDKRPKSASTYLSENEEMCKTWNSKYNNTDAISSKNNYRRNTIVLNGQSNATMIHSGKHNLTYSRTFCSWKAKKSSCSQDHKCVVLQNDVKCMSQNQAVKRGYNSLESERYHRKRRQHSYPSDESLNHQNYLPEEILRPSSTSVAPCNPKKKWRRKRSKFHTKFEALDLKENTNYFMKNSPSLSNPDELISKDKKEEMKPQEVTDIESNSENTDQVEHNLTLDPSNLLPSETNGETEHSVMEITSGEFSEVSGDPSTSAYVASVPTKVAIENTLFEHKKRCETINTNGKQIPSKVPSIEKNFRQPQPKSYFCHYELAEALPQGKMNEASTEWLQYNSGILNTQPPLPFKEAHVSGHTFVTAEQILAPLTLPEQTLLIPLENHDKFKDLPCEAYQHIIQPNMLANKVKFTFPPAALPPPSTTLQPLPLQQPLCSTSVTTIHHTVWTFKVLQPHQQFLSQVPALSRTSLPQISVGPRLCPGNHPTFVAPPQMPIIPASVLHPSHLAFPPLPHALFPSLLSPHPTVIPLQPLF
uniref:Zinc finger protein 804A n=1 Tax=Loxodonta africana TaxID=9785 RepID=G3SYF8_LOXAF